MQIIYGHLDNIDSHCCLYLIRTNIYEDFLFLMQINCETYLLYVMQIMSDKNIEDTDIEPAPKLIEVVFHNCKGQVDQWVEPYLRITIDRLRRAEKPYLKCLLIQVVRVYLRCWCSYVPILFLCSYWTC